MNAENPNIQPDLPPIRQLDAVAANRIAAGEVVERPASAIKELVENALDAGARRIDVSYADGGKRLLRVSDDGHGIPAEALPLALARHATSKIDGTNLTDIHTFGFRGEALPSLGAVGRLSLSSRALGAGEAATITVRGGDAGPVRPVGLARGTVVELAGLFSATPARLKFLRSDRAEAQAIGDVVRRLAMASPGVAFTLSDVSDPDAPRSLLRLNGESDDFFDGLQARLRAVLGAEFVANSLSVDAGRETLRLTGYAALPTYSRGAAVAQYLFVNDRPVRDKLLIGALRAAYSDVLPRGRHPVVALFVSCPPEDVDVNVHPAKSEVRFRDPGVVRGLVVGALKQTLAEAGHRGATTTGAGMLGAFRPENAMVERPGPERTPHAPGGGANMFGAAAWSGRVEPEAPAGMCETAEEYDAADDMPLGVARAQVHQTYVIAQTADGVVIVDQHAAHERLVYEKLKAERSSDQAPSQILLIPEIVEMDSAALARLAGSADDMTALGLVYEPFGGNAVCLRQTPAILGEVDGAALLRDVADALEEGAAEELGARIDAVVSRMSCHGSIRAGRRMSAPEMNALLREMETTPLSGQCNHGRPTYVELKLDDIERLFGRR